MNRDFDNVNKQIAGFIIVSAAVVAPAITPVESGIAQAEPVAMVQDFVARYAGPVMPQQDLTVPIVRYAGPPKPQPTQNQTIARYSDSEVQTVNKDTMPMVKYAGPQMQSGKVNIKRNSNNSKTKKENNNYGLIKLESGHYIYK